jgi:WD40 repeat protein
VATTPAPQQTALGQLSGAAKLTCLAFSGHEQSTLAAADCEGTVHVFDVATQQLALDIDAHDGRIWAIDFAPGAAAEVAFGDGGDSLGEEGAGSGGGDGGTHTHCFVTGSDDYTVRVRGLGLNHPMEGEGTTCVCIVQRCVL